MCTNFSSIMILNWDTMAPGEKDRKLTEARTHLEFCAQIYKIQHQIGSYFLHEHSQAATSWHEKCICEVVGLPAVIRVTAHMCQSGMKMQTQRGKFPVMKPIGFLTNSTCIAHELNRKCPGSHEHATLMGGFPKSGPAGSMKNAQKYPPDLCRAICRGLIKQKKDDFKGMSTPGTKEEQTEGELEEAVKSSEELHESEKWMQAWDDVSGRELQPELVRKARTEKVCLFPPHEGLHPGAHRRVPQSDWKRTDRGAMGGHQQAG